jgi:hypothetical protein
MEVPDAIYKSIASRTHVPDPVEIADCHVLVMDTELAAVVKAVKSRAFKK